MKTILTITFLIIPLLFVALESSHGLNETQEVKSNSSVWLAKAHHHRRQRGCSYRPWICKERFPPFEWRLCCNNHCVDIGFDNNNCGLCGIRCPFSWQCCNGVCIDTMINPLHCGSCSNRCPIGSLCSYGLCSYAEPLPPFLFSPKHRKATLPEPPVLKK